MLNENVHSTDEELLQAADGELPNRRSTQVHAHLATCWECRTRMSEIESTIASFMRVHRQTFDSELPPIAGPRALLRAQLAELASKSQPRSERWFIQLTSAKHTAVLLCAAILIMAASGMYFFQHSTPRSSNSTAATLERGTVPDPTLTPGATRAVAIRDVCSMAHEEVVAEVSSSLQQEVFREYGIVNARPSDYEIDYLIAPGLGGTEDIRNLWPEPHGARTWNAYVKDTLEEHLHHQVCAGKLDLYTAQRDIATDWIAAYKKYFHTDSPLPVSGPQLSLPFRTLWI
jgi:hypothetical protein